MQLKAYHQHHHLY